MQYVVIYILLIQSLVAIPVVTMNKTTYDLNDFYQEYGKKEWEGASLDQKKELINDFINRRLATIEAIKMGLDNKPDITKKLYNREQLALINITYEELVAKPLISKELLDKTREHIMEERLLRHLVISYNSANIANPSDRTIDEAFLLAQKISNDLQNGGIFIDYALKYSEDPTVSQNEGRLDWIAWGRTIPAFQESAFLLKKGAVSKPVLTDYGYHIIFCEDIRPSEYASLDDEIDGFHFYLAFIKFGIGRTSSDSAHEIRDGKITREEGATLVKRFDHEFPEKYYKIFLDYCSMTDEDAHKIIDSWRSDHLWYKENDEWKLRHAVWHEYEEMQYKC